jgi:hypothetical protein
MYRSLLAGGFLMIACSTDVSAQVAIDDIRLQLFKERSGSLSENVAGSRKSFVNTPKGEGDIGEPAEAVLVTLAFTGPKNGRASEPVISKTSAIFFPLYRTSRVSLL